MLVSLWHYCKGYVIVEIEGDNVEKFLNLITYHGIIIWHLTEHEDKIRFSLLAYDFKNIKRELRKSNCKIKIIKKCGLPFIAFRYKKRRLFEAGILVFILTLWIIASFVWRIDVEGTTLISSGEILKTLEQHGYKTGKLKAKMNLRQAEKVLLGTYPDLVWVGMDYEGTRLIVNVSERVMPPEMFPTEPSPKSLFAKRDALITYVAVEKGKPAIRVGDTVQKGDLLVAGEMPLGEENPSLYYTSAKGRVRGKTVYVVSKQMAFNQVKKEYTGVYRKQYTLKFFNKSVPISWKQDLKSPYDTQHIIHQLSITKLFPLPFSINEEIQYAYKPRTCVLTEEEVKDFLLSELWKEISCHLSKDAKVLDRTAYFKKTDEFITGTLSIMAEEDISYEMPIEKQIPSEGAMNSEQNGSRTRD